MVGSTLEEIIGGNIARYRKASGITQATLAEKNRNQYRFCLQSGTWSKEDEA